MVKYTVPGLADANFAKKMLQFNDSVLDEAVELGAGNPKMPGVQCLELRSLLKNLTILGGCCGTDNRHIAAISKHFMDS